ncbi:MAG: glycosyltransferase [Gemmatimonadales bacterium]
MGPVVFFCMKDAAHFQRVRPLVAVLAAAAVEVHVFTDPSYRASVEGLGARFANLYADQSIEDVDGISMPVSCRFVSFAGLAADPIIERVRALRPAVIAYDGFALIGRVVAGVLGLPSALVCAGHDVDPVLFRRNLLTDGRVRLAEPVRRAVEILRDRYRIAEASPFSYVADPSPDLNVYGEPEEFLSAAGRRRLEPLFCFGSLPPAEELGPTVVPPDRDDERPVTRLYVSFGTVVWRYWAAEALAGLRVIRDVVARRPELRAVMSLGGAAVAEADRETLRAPNVDVASYVDQWQVLATTDAFVTHHGLCSTHEAVFHEVPMISQPFFWDQPGLAARCQAFGIAVPLSDAPRGAFDEAAFSAALDRVIADRVAMRRGLRKARSWEVRTIAGRDAIVNRFAALEQAR